MYIYLWLFAWNYIVLQWQYYIVLQWQYSKRNTFYQTKSRFENFFFNIEVEWGWYHDWSFLPEVYHSNRGFEYLLEVEILSNECMESVLQCYHRSFCYIYLISSGYDSTRKYITLIILFMWIILMEYIIYWMSSDKIIFCMFKIN